MQRFELDEAISNAAWLMRRVEKWTEPKAEYVLPRELASLLRHSVGMLTDTLTLIGQHQHELGETVHGQE